MTPTAWRQFSARFAWTWIVAVVGIGVTAALICWRAGPRTDDEVGRLTAAFRDYTGVDLVFDREELPPGRYHEVMPPLDVGDREEAARIALGEAHKFPRRYFAKLGLSTIGIFASCVSTRADGFREYDEELRGYSYYGIYNGSSAIAAAYYTDRQLPLTINHEIFHHVERVAGQANSGGTNRRWAAALSGDALYSPLDLAPADLAALESCSGGEVLEDTVSDYAAKNPMEDRAETARYLLSHLPDGLVQAARRPNLPGSQRILHVLATYREAAGGNGPDAKWFVDVALGRANGTAGATSGR